LSSLRRPEKFEISEQEVIYSIARVRSGKTVDWGHPVLEHVKGIVSMKNAKPGNEPANAGKATVIEKENEISNKMIKTVVRNKL
jgi:hypothetical protein